MSLLPWLMIVVSLIGSSPLSLSAQAKKPSTLSELVTYTGADREQILVGGAKAEGKVVWYTSLAGSSYRELAQGFEKKYPGIKVDVYRAASNELMAKITAEANAGNIWSTPLKRLYRYSKVCVRTDSWRSINLPISPNIRRAPRRARETDFTTGASTARVSSVLVSIPI